MSTFLWVLLIILIILVVAVIVLYFLGKRLQKRQPAQQEQMDAAKQTVTMLVIDKKMMRLKDAGLPQMVVDQTPKLMRRNKLPIVKARVGSRIMTMVADAKVYDIIPVKKEVKAVISGIYIMEVYAIRGSLDTPPVKKGWRARMAARLGMAQGKVQDEIKATEKAKAKGSQAKNAAKATGKKAKKG